MSDHEKTKSVISPNNRLQQYQDFGAQLSRKSFKEFQLPEPTITSVIELNPDPYDKNNILIEEEDDDPFGTSKSFQANEPPNTQHRTILDKTSTSLMFRQRHSEIKQNISSSIDYKQVDAKPSAKNATQNDYRSFFNNTTKKPFNRFNRNTSVIHTN